MDDSRSDDFGVVSIPMSVGGDSSVSLAPAANVPAGAETKQLTLKEVLFEHGRFVRITLSHLGVRSKDLDDVEIEVLLGVHRGMPAFDPSLSKDPSKAVRAWLFGICERQAATHRRKTLRCHESLCNGDELDKFESATLDAEAMLLEKQHRSLLIELLTETTSERRAVLLAYDIEGGSMREVALVLGIPVNTAWNRRRLGLDNLRAAVRRKKTAAL